MADILLSSPRGRKLEKVGQNDESPAVAGLP